ncbi:hypothetical protein IG631_02999 [Alternaria alternata]|nr:hypothetical protein IG631_02999 [Alternaria alternata]
MAAGADIRLTRQTATQQRRLYQCHRHVQGCVPLGLPRRGGNGAQVPKDVPFRGRRRGRRKRVDCA